jgi:ferric-dicitrate binding protein FerR (iron transport regulator)
VNTNFTSGKVVVMVKTGKVKFYEPDKSKKGLILESGSLGAIDEKSAVKKLIDDPNYLAWKTKYFDFSKGERLDKVIATINKAYGVQIVMENPALAKRTIATVYDDKPLDMVLELLCQSLMLETRMYGDTIILKEK